MDVNKFVHKIERYFVQIEHFWDLLFLLMKYVFCFPARKPNDVTQTEGGTNKELLTTKTKKVGF